MKRPTALIVLCAAGAVSTTAPAIAAPPVHATHLSHQAVVHGDLITATATASRAGAYAYLLSRDAVRSPDDRVLGHAIAHRRPGRRAVLVSKTLTIPRWVQPHLYHLLICAFGDTGATCAAPALRVERDAGGTDDTGGPGPVTSPVPGPFTDLPPADSCADGMTRIVATSPTTVEITYRAAVDPGSVVPNASNYAIGGLSVTGAHPAGYDVTLTTSAQTPGRTYQLLSGDSVRSQDGSAFTQGPTLFAGYDPGAAPAFVSPTAACPSTTAVPAPHCDAMRVIRLEATSATTIAITFSAPVDASTVKSDGSDFFIGGVASPGPFVGGFPIASVTVSADTVTLTTASQDPGHYYQLLFTTSVRDLAGDELSQPPTYVTGFDPSGAPYVFTSAPCP